MANRPRLRCALQSTYWLTGRCPTSVPAPPPSRGCSAPGWGGLACRRGPSRLTAAQSSCLFWEASRLAVRAELACKAAADVGRSARMRAWHAKPGRGHWDSISVSAWYCLVPQIRSSYPLLVLQSFMRSCKRWTSGLPRLPAALPVPVAAARQAPPRPSPPLKYSSAPRHCCGPPLPAGTFSATWDDVLSCRGGTLLTAMQYALLKLCLGGIHPMTWSTILKAQWACLHHTS